MFQLAHTIDEIPKSDDWIYEIKEDGERIKAIKKGDRVELWNRDRKTNRHRFEKSNVYPEVTEDLMIQIHDFVIDGEVNCSDRTKGLDMFNRRALLSDQFKIRIMRGVIPVKFRVFDILEINGKDVTDVPLILRKSILDSFIEETENIEIVKYWFSDNVDELWDLVEKFKLEGIMAKRKVSPYVTNRTYSWLKIKNIKETVVNIINYKETSGQGSHGGLITDRCDVALTTEQLRREYFAKKPTKARLRYYGVYPSGKLRNPVLLELIR